MPRYVHPFPARMAPAIAVNAVSALGEPGVVLDPMCGSGTSLLAAARVGHRAIGFDLDPLAVLVSRIATSRLRGDTLRDATDEVLAEAEELPLKAIDLPWMDDDIETREFVRYWFAIKQRNALRRLAYVLYGMRGPSADALRIALSRTIITKESGASLARDVSHSRPHRVADRIDFDVFRAFERAASQVADYLDSSDYTGSVTITRRDARRLPGALRKSVDLVVTSPPYLNAIDYMRGHRLSLVWLGHSVAELREVRSDSVGSERAPDSGVPRTAAQAILRRSWPAWEGLPDRFRSMLERYAIDAAGLMGEISRVLKRSGMAVLVVGDSSVGGAFVSNSRVISGAACEAGLVLTKRRSRSLPNAHRYLPPPRTRASSDLDKRMRREVVLTFVSG
jgi:SAM-dependent methyltransferase